MICVASHRFDIARQGYVSLLDGRSTPHRSDTAAMVAARRRVHESGLFDPVVRAVADASGTPTDRAGTSDRPPLVLDAGAGTGRYLAGALAGSDAWWGIGLDLSKYCARAVARVHPRAAAVVADIWRPLPIRTASVGVVLSVFSPRNIDEFARVLHSGGVLVVVTPNADHLAEIVGPMDMLGIAEDKDQRLRTALGDRFEITAEHEVRHRADLDATAIGDLVAMGPSAFHRTADEIRSAAEAVTHGSGRSAVSVSVSVSVTVCRPTPPGPLTAE
ncbi:methyltransferase domain-containing protein [Gordonia sp. HNM0687]|uniref:Methyltransferase domain-containing protein n=1 Tax=Gordonia mangrovi TaxID=2665643 RepID=A0A6L7GLR8_9ACTN|nr:methyltransferase domain-containing protein [Gordonia mangrovi]UVF80546.1 rRNA methyltransferase [Gordonia mangrovi]